MAGLKHGPVKHVTAAELDGAPIRIGDQVPMPPKGKLKVRPSRNADSPAKGPRGAFTNGRGKG